MKLRYNYRLYPSPKQELLMKQAGGTCRWLWNHLLEENIKKYKEDKKFIFYHDMAISLPQLKQEHTWLKDTYSQVLQQVAKDLDQALKNCFKTKFGFPKWKKKYEKRDSFRYMQHTKIEGNGTRYARLRLPKIGDMRIRLHRELPKYTSVTIYQENDKWFASFVVEKKEQSKPDQINKVIGIDVNSKAIVATSDQEIIDNPKFKKQKIKQLKALQRALSRKEKKSSSNERARRRLSLLHRQIQNRRKNFIHQVSHRIAKYGVLVCAETLNIQDMSKNHPVAIAIGDAGWAMLFDMLKYKAELRGGFFHQINQWLTSSKTCNKCGNVKEKLDLDERTYSCDICNHVIDRDINAALNIKEWGLQEFNELNDGISIPRQELPGTPLDVMADILSSDMISASTMKEEAK